MFSFGSTHCGQEIEKAPPRGRRRGRRFGYTSQFRGRALTIFDWYGACCLYLRIQPLAWTGAPEPMGRERILKWLRDESKSVSLVVGAGSAVLLCWAHLTSSLALWLEIVARLAMIRKIRVKFRRFLVVSPSLILGSSMRMTISSAHSPSRPIET